MFGALCRWFVGLIVPDRALRVVAIDDEIRVVVRPEIVDFAVAHHASAVPAREERTWWPGVGVVVRSGEKLEDFLARIDVECDDA